MVDLELSDLFFNSPRPNYTACTNDDVPSKWIAALYDDAINFVRDYPNLCRGISAQELSDNYWSRV